MTRLTVDEEIEQNHYHFVLPEHSYLFYGFWTVFIIIIVVMTHLNEYSEPVIPWDNCDMNKTWEPPMRAFINNMQLRSELHKIAKFREKNSLYRKNNYSRIEYGTSLLSYCKANGKVTCDWEKKEAEVQVPDGLIIKSITRTVELDPYFSSGLRFLVLECMSFRMTMALIRSTDVLTSRTLPFPTIIQFVLSFAPWLSCLQSFSLFLMTNLHSEFDREYFAFFQPYAYMMVGVFTFLEMLSDLLQDAYDGRFVFIQTPRFYIKSAFFVIFSACFPYVILHWVDFYKVKRCHAYVPLMDGIFEYVCAASIIAYNFINAQTNVEMYITPTSEDVRNVSSYSSDVYHPVCYGERSVIYESLNSVRR
ncbi:hypothetical protein CAEBREN_23000 [Caenorhabditis brenneri]|uniref:Uncharacterized protein n=1 Tax=Caenorhabditis brenneri TaxID=135651 RepID=G0PBR9_CAEBE|nr:hypothetical protein CAEBREN_23000 [Caenorhabditis brenneri]